MSLLTSGGCNRDPSGVTTLFKWVDAKTFAETPVGHAARGKHIALWCVSPRLMGATWVGAFDATDVALLETALNADASFLEYDTLLDARFFSGFTPTAFVAWVRCSRNYEARRRGRLRRQITVLPQALHLAAMCHGFSALLKPAWEQRFVEDVAAACALVDADAAALDDLGQSLLRGSQTLAYLSKREQEIVVLAIQGYSDLNIATQLELSEATIGSHLNRIFRRLKVHSRVELAARCQDLLPPE